MSNVLYRKHRPKSFAEIHGQQLIVDLLKHSLVNDKFSHAYLFSGPRGTGKTSMARLVAKALNCHKFKQEGELCNECATCISIESGGFVDLFEIDAASNRGIDEIRQIRENIEFMPTEGQLKVYIIDEVHMLTKEAFNALLKTIEEPPSHIVFILATTEPHKIPVTILSRVQRYDFQLGTKEQLGQKLSRIAIEEGITFADGTIDLLHEYSQGSFRDAESLLGKLIIDLDSNMEVTTLHVDKVIGRPDKRLIKEMVEALVEGDKKRGLSLAEDIISSGVSFPVFSQELIKKLRDEAINEGDNSISSRSLLIKIIKNTKELSYLQDSKLALELLVLFLVEGGDSYSKKEFLPQSKDNAPTNEHNQGTPNTAKKEGASPKVIIDLKSEKKEVSESKPKTESESDDLNEQLKEKALNAIKTSDFEAWLHMRTCSIEVNGSSVRVKTPYKVAVDKLSSAEVISLIKGAVGPFVQNPEVMIDYDGSVDDSINNNDSVANGNQRPREGSSNGEAPSPNTNIVEEIF